MKTRRWVLGGLIAAPAIVAMPSLMKLPKYVGTETGFNEVGPIYQRQFSFESLMTKERTRWLKLECSPEYIIETINDDSVAQMYLKKVKNYDNTALDLEWPNSSPVDFGIDEYDANKWLVTTP